MSLCPNFKVLCSVLVWSGHWRTHKDLSIMKSSVEGLNKSEDCFCFLQGSEWNASNLEELQNSG